MHHFSHEHDIAKYTTIISLDPLIVHVQNYPIGQRTMQETGNKPVKNMRILLEQDAAASKVTIKSLFSQIRLDRAGWWQDVRVHPLRKKLYRVS